MKVIKIGLLTLLLLASTFAFAEGTEEVLLGIDIQPNSLELHVASGGCTSAGDFNIEVNKGITGKSPYMVTVFRVKPDNCKAMLLDGVKVSFDRESLELEGLLEFTITNKLGNTSNHR